MSNKQNMKKRTLEGPEIAGSSKKQMENHKYFLLKWSGSQRGEGYILNPKHETREELLQIEGVRAFTFVACDRRPKTWVVNFKTKEEVIAFISKRAEIIEQRLKEQHPKSKKRKVDEVTKKETKLTFEQWCEIDPKHYVHYRRWGDKTLMTFDEYFSEGVTTIPKDTKQIQLAHEARKNLGISEDIFKDYWLEEESEEEPEGEKDRTQHDVKTIECATQIETLQKEHEKCLTEYQEGCRRLRTEYDAKVARIEQRKEKLLGGTLKFE